MLNNQGGNKYSTKNKINWNPFYYMKNKIIALVLTFLAFNCEEPIDASIDISDPTPTNLENTLNDNLSDVGTYDEYFYDFQSNVDAQFHKYTSFHLSGGVFNPEEDTLNFKTFPDFFVSIDPLSDFDALTETIFDTTYQSVSQKDLTFEINDPVSRIDSLVWEQVSGDEFRYVVYSTRLENLTEPHDISVNDTFINNFHQSIIDDIQSDYILIDTLEWDTTLTYNYFENSNVLEVPNGTSSIADLAENTSISYQFIVDTMVVVSSDSLMYKDVDGTIGDKMDSLLVSYIDEAYEDLNGNGNFDPTAEPYIDTNGNGQYDLAETFTDGDGDGLWDDAEEFTDDNGNGVWDEYSEYNETLDQFFGNNNGICDDPVGTSWTDINGNGICDITEEYVDENGNGEYDSAEALVDIDGDGVWDDAEPYTDTNGNGSYDFAEPYTDTNGNGEYDTFVETQLTHIYPGDALINLAGESFPLLDYIFDYSYYKTLNYLNINSVNEVVNNHIIIQDDTDVTQYKLAKTQTDVLDPATSLIEHEYNYHLLNIDDDGIKKFIYPSYFNYYGEWGIEDGEDELYDFFGPEGHFGFWFEENGVDEILFYLQGGQNFRDGEVVQTFEIDTTDHAIYYITKDYQVERDTVSVPYKNNLWDSGVCMTIGGNQDGLANSSSESDCISDGNLWHPEEEYEDIDGSGSYTDGEDFIDGHTFIFKDECFKITRVLSMEMKGTGVVYNERNITWLAKDLYVVKDEVSYSWGDQEWNPYSKILLSDFRNNGESSLARNGLLNNLLGDVKRININDLDKHPETDFKSYNKVRSVGIQKIGTSY